jgi:cytochrome c-type biogenesis protein CcmE
MKPKYIIGAAIILIFLVFAGVNFQKSLTPYVSLTEAKKKGTTVQIKGARVEGSEEYNVDSKTFNFKLMDGSGEKFQVIYHGVKPSNFEHATEVVARGRYQSGAFEADEILIKCPSKYEAESAEGVKS